MEILIGWLVVNDMDGAITDSLARQGLDPTDKTYLKIHEGRPTKRGVIIDADIDDLVELWNRADFDLETCEENLRDAYDPEEKREIRSRLNAHRRMRDKITPHIRIDRKSCHGGIIRTAVAR